MRLGERRRAARDAVAALLLCVFTLASTASPSLAAERTLERVVRLVAHTITLRPARGPVADRSLIATRLAVAVRASLRDDGGRGSFPVGPVLPVCDAPAIGDVIENGVVALLEPTTLASHWHRPLARARAPPASI